MIALPNASNYIVHLHLQPHPEGDFYKETYRSAENVAQQALPSILKEKEVFPPLYIFFSRKAIIRFFIE
ncbi:MAG: cupin domain-containing protein [Ginsengibacter sp.]